MKDQQHAVTYDSKIDVLSIVKEMCDLKQICTQSAGLRPFGVSMLVAGVDEDDSIKLFLTEPYGLYFQYKAVSIGEGDAEVDAILNKRWKPNMSVEEGIRLGLSAMKELLKSEFNFDRVDAGYVDVKSKRFKKLSNDELKRLAK